MVAADAGSEDTAPTAAAAAVATDTVTAAADGVAAARVPDEDAEDTGAAVGEGTPTCVDGGIAEAAVAGGLHAAAASGDFRGGCAAAELREMASQLSRAAEGVTAWK
jgi:hypothetical protein